MVASGNGLLCGSVLPFVWDECEIGRKALGSVPDDFQEHWQNIKNRLLPSACLVRPSVRPSASNNSAPSRKILTKFGIWAFFENLSTKTQHSLTLRRLMSYIYIYLFIYIYMYMEHPFLMFLDHTQRRSTVGRTPLDE